MTSWRVLAGFGAGFVVAGAVAGLARVAGLDEPPAAIADVETPAAAARPGVPADAPAPASASAASAEAPPVAAPAAAGAAPSEEKPSRRWRTPRKHAADEVPAGVIARVASRRGAERRCPSAETDPENGAAAVPSPQAKPCADVTGRVDAVEIEWHGPAPKP